jgi:transmembrane sensor
MNASFPSSDPATEDQAALWAARLDGSELSIAERRALNEWLALNPSHRTLLSHYCQFAVDLEQPLTSLVSSGAVAMPVATPSKTVSRWKLLTGSAILAMAAAVMVAVWVAQPTTELNTIATAIGQRQSITLSDGTRVELNAHTRLEVAISPTERRVRLSAGEAFFAVHKDPHRPFLIETPAGSIRVMGTTFNVRTERASSIEVTVVEGSVQVRAGSRDSSASTPILIGAGDRLLGSPQGVTVKALSTAAIDNALAWRRGQIVFEGVPLQEAVSRFADYHGRPISVSSGAAQLLLGGRYNLDDLTGFLNGLEELFPVQVVRNADSTVQIVLRDER